MLPHENSSAGRRSLDPGQVNVLEAAALGDTVGLRQASSGRGSTITLYL